MAEDLEKYRGLYGIVKNPVNSKQVEKLYDPTGLFGVQSKYPTAFELFADWIREVKFINHTLTDNSIKVEKFKDFLRKQKGNEELIKVIDDLHSENMIKDRTPFDNTLLQFALELDSLGITKEHGKSLGRYREIRRNMLSMKPLPEKKVDAKTTSGKVGQDKPGIGGKVSPVATKTPEGKEVSSTSTGGGGGYEPSETTNLTASVSTNSTTEIPTEEKNEAEKPVENLVIPTVPETPISPITPSISATPATPVTPVSQKPAEVSPISPTITSKTSELKEARMREEKKAARGGEAQLEQPQTSAIPTIALPHFGKIRGKGRRVVARRGAHGDKVRQISTKEGPQRVQPDTARNRLTQNAQANAQNEQDNYDNQLTQNARNQQAAEEGEEEGSTKKGSLAKKVLTGVGAGTVAGGGFFAFLAGDTEAATFAISHASTTFKSLISLIHLFIK